MEKTLDFKKDMATYVKIICSLPMAEKTLNAYKRGLLTLHEAFDKLQDAEKNMQSTYETKYAMEVDD